MIEINTAPKNSMQKVIDMENSSIPQPNEDAETKNQELLRIKTGYNQHTSPPFLRSEKPLF
jgi:hypothetical protein